MSFGFSVGDFALLCQLARRGYRSCKAAGGEYLELAREVKVLHSVLRNVREEAERTDSTIFQQDSRAASELSSIADGCKSVLLDMENLLSRNHGLAQDGVESSATRRLWHRIRFGANLEEHTKFQSKIVTYTSSLAVILDSIQIKATGRVENKVDVGFAEVLDQFQGMRKAVLEIATSARAAQRHGSVSSVESELSLSTYAEDDKRVWRRFRSELISLDFRSDALDRHKDVLKAYMLKLNQSGVLDDAVAELETSQQPWCTNMSFRTTRTSLPAISEAEEVPEEIGAVNPPWVGGYHKQTSASVIDEGNALMDEKHLSTSFFPSARSMLAEESSDSPSKAETSNDQPVKMSVQIPTKPSADRPQIDVVQPQGNVISQKSTIPESNQSRPKIARRDTLPARLYNNGNRPGCFPNLARHHSLGSQPSQPRPNTKLRDTSLDNDSVHSPHYQNGLSDNYLLSTTLRSWLRNELERTDAHPPEIMMNTQGKEQPRGQLPGSPQAVINLNAEDLSTKANNLTETEGNSIPVPHSPRPPNPYVESHHSDNESVSTHSTLIRPASNIHNPLSKSSARQPQTSSGLSLSESVPSKCTVRATVTASSENEKKDGQTPRRSVSSRLKPKVASKNRSRSPDSHATLFQSKFNRTQEWASNLPSAPNSESGLPPSAPSSVRISYQTTSSNDVGTEGVKHGPETVSTSFSLDEPKYRDLKKSVRFTNSPPNIAFDTTRSGVSTYHDFAKRSSHSNVYEPIKWNTGSARQGSVTDSTSSDAGSLAAKSIGSAANALAVGVAKAFEKGGETGILLEDNGTSAFSSAPNYTGSQNEPVQKVLEDMVRSFRKGSALPSKADDDSEDGESDSSGKTSYYRPPVYKPGSEYLEKSTLIESSDAERILKKSAADPAFSPDFYQKKVPKPRLTYSEDKTDYGSSDEENELKKARGKGALGAGLALVSTINAANNLYELMEKRNERLRAVSDGEITPEEARKLKAKARLQDAAGIGIVALGIKESVSRWKATRGK
jgi:hypothetical protein